MVLRALGASASAQDLVSCIRESSFREMYEAAGREDLQEAIRTVTPDAPHCPFLLESANACNSLPFSVDGGAKLGDPCPNNPFTDVRNEQLLHDAETNYHIAERAIQLSQLADLGMLKMETITAAEFRAIVSVGIHRSNQQQIQPHRRNET